MRPLNRYVHPISWFRQLLKRTPPYKIDNTAQVCGVVRSALENASMRCTRSILRSMRCIRSIMSSMRCTRSIMSSKKCGWSADLPRFEIENTAQVRGVVRVALQENSNLKWADIVGRVTWGGLPARSDTSDLAYKSVEPNIRLVTATFPIVESPVGFWRFYLLSMTVKLQHTRYSGFSSGCLDQEIGCTHSYSKVS
jgi:hypothetical protein